MRRKDWYGQTVVRGHERMVNGNILRLSDGTRIKIWTHPGSAPFDRRVLDIEIQGKSFDEINISRRKGLK